jgi:hypothetical protein
MSRGELLNLFFERFVEEHLVQPTFIYDYPIEISPLTKRKPGRPDLVERAAARKREILSTHYPDYLPRAMDEVIRARHDIKLPREVMEMGDPRWIK